MVHIVCVTTSAASDLVRDMMLCVCLCLLVSLWLPSICFVDAAVMTQGSRGT